jgi:bifunctional DNase/RNase
MEKVELVISALAPARETEYILIMREVNGFRRLPIVIGMNEAQAIAVEVEGITRPRPWTHDLFVNSLSAFGIFLNEVIISKVDEERIFYSTLVLEQASTGTKIKIDSRTSDAIALAIRFKTKIFASEQVMSKSAISLSSFENEMKNKSKNDVTKKRIEMFEKQLDLAIENEKYEEASKLRDEINYLKSQLRNSD